MEPSKRARQYRRRSVVEALEQRTLLAIIYSANMDADPGWTLDTVSGVGWGYGTPAGTGGDPSAGYTGTKVVGTIIASPGTYPPGVPVSALYARTAATDCSNYTGVTLSFYRWLRAESGDVAQVQVSNNGTNWTTLFTNNPGVFDTSWSLQTYDISAVADRGGTVYLRWRLSSDGDSSVWGGWNIDDVTISGTLDTPPTVLSVNRVGASPTNASSVQFTVAFSEPVTGVDVSDFTQTLTGTASGTISSVSGSGSSYTVTVSSVAGDGTLGLNLVDNDTIVDAFSKPLGGAGTGNGDFTGQTYTLDQTPPAVVSINRVGTSPTNASSVQFSATFSEPVTGVDVSDFELSGGAYGAIASISQSSGANYTITVSPVSGDGTLGLNLLDNDTIIDWSSNPLGGVGAGNGSFIGQTYALDHTPPSVIAINRLQPSPTNQSEIQWSLTFIENVWGVDLTDFVVEGTGGAFASWAAITGAGNSYTYTATVIGTGVLTLQLRDDDTIIDSVGHKLGGTGHGNGDFTGESYIVDHLSPVATAINRVQPSPTNASPIQWSVTFNEAVSGVGVSDFDIITSGTAAASGATITGSGNSYTYTVTPSGVGDLTLRLVDDDTITDIGGNPLGGTGSGNGSMLGQTFTVDRVVPAVVSIVSGETSNPSEYGFYVTFSESVTGVDVSDFAATFTGSATGTVTGVTGSGNYYTVIVLSPSGDGTVQIALVDDDTIVDGLGNELGGTGEGNGNFTSGSRPIDHTPPTVASISRNTPSPTNSDIVMWDVVFSESVTGVGASDFAVTATDSARYGVLSVSGLGTNWLITLDYVAGAGTLTPRLVDNDTIIDSCGNKLGGTGEGNGNATGESTEVERVWPTVTSIVALPSGPYPDWRYFTVTFSEEVTGVNWQDFSAVFSGSATGGVASVTGSGDTYSVRVEHFSGNGEVRLDLVDNDSIADAIGNPLGGVGAGNGNFTGATAPVDHVAPVVSWINLVYPALTNRRILEWSIHFSEAVSGVDPTDFALQFTGYVYATSPLSVSGSGQDYTLSVSVDESGTVTPQFADDDTIMDLCGNRLGGLGLGNGDFTGATYTVDQYSPVASSIQPLSTSDPDVRVFQVDFIEDVTGVDVTDFIASFTETAAGVISLVSGGPRSYMLSVGSLVGDGNLRVDLVDHDSIWDAAGNPLGGIGDWNGNFLGMEAQVDHTAPQVVSIIRLDSTPTNLPAIRWHVQFNEDVMGIDASDFSIVSTGTIGFGLWTVTGAGEHYALTLNNVSGNGTVTPRLWDNDSIHDMVGNPLGAAATLDGESYTIDHIAPQVTSISVNAGAAQRSMVKELRVVFSEAVDLASGAVQVVRRDGAAVSGVNVTNSLGDKRTWDLTFSTASGSLGDGIFKLVTTGSKVSDLAGNAMTGESTVVFHRLFGDADGDRDVDNADLIQFRTAMKVYNSIFDFDNDGLVNGTDYVQLKSRLIRRVLR